jgi:hypothetical protein
MPKRRRRLKSAKSLKNTLLEVGPLTQAIAIKKLFGIGRTENSWDNFYMQEF